MWAKSKRVIALVMSVIFVTTDISWAAPAQPLPRPSMNSELKFELAPEFGQIDESYQGTSKKTIIYIQDAHDSLEAQENIAKIINSLVIQNGVKTVFEEGYEGPVPTDKYFDVIQDPVIREKVAYYLMDHLGIGGAEYAHINRFKSESLNSKHETISNDQNSKIQNKNVSNLDHSDFEFVSDFELRNSDFRPTDWQLMGADSIKLHKANIKAYRRAARQQKGIASDLTVLEKEIRALANLHFPSELKEWMRQKEAFDENRLPLLDYLKRTLGFMSRKAYPGIQLILEAEKSTLPEVLEKARQMNAKDLFIEIEKMEMDLAKEFLKNERDRKIFGYYREIRLLKRLNDLCLSFPEYQAVQGSLDRLNTQQMGEFIGLEAKKTLVLSKRWEKKIKEAIRFYDIAERRDEVISKQLETFLKNPNEQVAILVFGGFHKNSIREILKKQDFSYSVVTPQIGTPSSRHKDYYKKLMSGGHLPFALPAPLRTASRPETRFEMALDHPELFRAELRTLTSVAESMPNSSSSDFNLSVEQSHKMGNTESVRSEVRRNLSTAKLIKSLDSRSAFVRANALSKIQFSDAVQDPAIKKALIRVSLHDSQYPLRDMAFHLLTQILDPAEKEAFRKQKFARWSQVSDFKKQYRENHYQHLIHHLELLKSLKDAREFAQHLAYFIVEYFTPGAPQYFTSYFEKTWRRLMWADESGEISRIFFKMVTWHFEASFKRQDVIEDLGAEETRFLRQVERDLRIQKFVADVDPPTESITFYLASLDQDTERKRFAYLLSGLLNRNTAKKRREVKDIIFSISGQDDPGFVRTPLEIQMESGALKDGHFPIKADFGIQLFPAEYRSVDYLTSRLMPGILSDARILALFWDDHTSHQLSYAHVFDSFAYARFYDRTIEGKRTLVVAEIQSDNYRYFKESRKDLKDWSLAVRLMLEHYALTQGYDQIVTPSAKTVVARWQYTGNAKGMNPDLARVIYDHRKLKRWGYDPKKLSIEWERGVNGEREWWVKSLHGLSYEAELRDLFKPAGAPQAKQGGPVEIVMDSLQYPFFIPDYRKWASRFNFEFGRQFSPRHFFEKSAQMMVVADLVGMAGFLPYYFEQGSNEVVIGAWMGKKIQSFLTVKEHAFFHLLTFLKISGVNRARLIFNDVYERQKSEEMFKEALSAGLIDLTSHAMLRVVDEKLIRPLTINPHFRAWHREEFSYPYDPGWPLVKALMHSWFPVLGKKVLSNSKNEGDSTADKPVSVGEGNKPGRSELRSLTSVTESMPNSSSADFNLKADQILHNSIFRSEVRHSDKQTAIQKLSQFFDFIENQMRSFSAPSSAAAGYLTQTVGGLAARVDALNYTRKKGRTLKVTERGGLFDEFPDYGEFLDQLLHLSVSEILEAGHKAVRKYDPSVSFESLYDSFFRMRFQAITSSDKQIEYLVDHLIPDKALSEEESKVDTRVSFLSQAVLAQIFREHGGEAVTFVARKFALENDKGKPGACVKKLEDIIAAQKKRSEVRSSIADSGFQSAEFKKQNRNVSGHPQSAFRIPKSERSEVRAQKKSLNSGIEKIISSKNWERLPFYRFFNTPASQKASVSLLIGGLLGIVTVLIGGYLTWDHFQSGFYASAAYTVLISSQIIAWAFGLGELVILNILLVFSPKQISQQSAPQSVSNEELPSVTVLIPVRNEPVELVMATLKAALRLDYPLGKLEIIIIDNSTTVDALKQPILQNAYKKLKEALENLEEVQTFRKQHGSDALTLIHREGTKGFKSGNLNLGMASSRGDFLLQLDADSLVKPETLRVVMPEFVHHEKNRRGYEPKLAFVQMGLEVSNHSENLLASSLASLHAMVERFWRPLRKSYRFETGFGHHLILSRRAIDEAGGFPEDIGSGEDTDLSIAIQLLEDEEGHSRWVGERADYHRLGETLPHQFYALKVQRWRWVYGNSQLFFKYYKAILKSHLPWYKKYSLLFDLGIFMATALVIVSAALIPPVLIGGILSGEMLIYPMALKMVIMLSWTAGFVAIYIAAMHFFAQSEEKAGLNIVLSFICNLLIGFALIPTILHAVWRTLVTSQEDFHVTPKGNSIKPTIRDTFKKNRPETFLAVYWLIFISFIPLAFGYTIPALLLSAGLIAWPFHEVISGTLHKAKLAISTFQRNFFEIEISTNRNIQTSHGWLKRTSFWILAAVIFGGAAYLRFHHLDYAGPWMDEATYLLTGRDIGNPDSGIGNNGWKWTYPVLAAWGESLYGSFVGARMVNGVIGMMTLFFIYLFSRSVVKGYFVESSGQAKIENIYALAAVGAVAFSSHFIFISRLATYDALAYGLFALSLYLTHEGAQSKKRNLLLAGSLVLFLSFLSKYVIVLFLPFMMSYALMLGKNARHWLTHYALPFFILWGLFFIGNFHAAAVMAHGVSGYWVNNDLLGVLGLTLKSLGPFTLLTALGVFFLPKDKRTQAGWLVGGASFLILYHVYERHIQALEKGLAAVLIIVSPLIGIAAARLFSMQILKSRVAKLFGVLCIVGILSAALSGHFKSYQKPFWEDLYGPIEVIMRESQKLQNPVIYTTRSGELLVFAPMLREFVNNKTLVLHMPEKLTDGERYNGWDSSEIIRGILSEKFDIVHITPEYWEGWNPDDKMFSRQLQNALKKRGYQQIFFDDRPRSTSIGQVRWPSMSRVFIHPRVTPSTMPTRNRSEIRSRWEMQGLKGADLRSLMGAAELVASSNHPSTISNLESVSRSASVDSAGDKRSEVRQPNADSGFQSAEFKKRNRNVSGHPQSAFRIPKSERSEVRSAPVAAGVDSKTGAGVALVVRDQQIPIRNLSSDLSGITEELEKLKEKYFLPGSIEIKKGEGRIIFEDSAGAPHRKILESFPPIQVNLHGADGLQKSDLQFAEELANALNIILRRFVSPENLRGKVEELIKKHFLQGKPVDIKFVWARPDDTLFSWPHHDIVGEFSGIQDPALTQVVTRVLNRITTQDIYPQTGAWIFDAIPITRQGLKKERCIYIRAIRSTTFQSEKRVLGGEQTDRHKRSEVRMSYPLELKSRIESIERVIGKETILEAGAEFQLEMPAEQLHKAESWLIDALAGLYLKHKHSIEHEQTALGKEGWVAHLFDHMKSMLAASRLATTDKVIYQQNFLKTFDTLLNLILPYYETSQSRACAAVERHLWLNLLASPENILDKIRVRSRHGAQFPLSDYKMIELVPDIHQITGAIELVPHAIGSTTLTLKLHRIINVTGHGAFIEERRRLTQELWKNISDVQILNVAQSLYTHRAPMPDWLAQNEVIIQRESSRAAVIIQRAPEEFRSKALPFRGLRSEMREISAGSFKPDQAALESQQVIPGGNGIQRHFDVFNVRLRSFGVRLYLDKIAFDPVKPAFNTLKTVLKLFKTGFDFLLKAVQSFTEHTERALDVFEDHFELPFTGIGLVKSISSHVFSPLRDLALLRGDGIVSAGSEVVNPSFFSAFSPAFRAEMLAKTVHSTQYTVHSSESKFRNPHSALESRSAFVSNSAGDSPAKLEAGKRSEARSDQSVGADTDFRSLLSEKTPGLAAVLRKVIERSQFDRCNREMRRLSSINDYEIQPYPPLSEDFFKSLNKNKTGFWAWLSERFLDTRREDAFAFFMFNISLSRKKLEDIFGDQKKYINDFMETGLFVRTTDGRIRLNGLSLASHQLPNGEVLYVFADASNLIKTGKQAARIYLQMDSYLLMKRMSKIQGISGYVVEPASGSGIQLIAALKQFPGIQKAIGVEIDQRALQVSCFNALLNGVSNKMVLVDSEAGLKRELQGNRISFALMNPPFIAIPDELRLGGTLPAMHTKDIYPRSGWGGPDGLTVTKQLLDMIFPLLQDETRVLIMSQFAGDSAGPQKIKDFIDSRPGMEFSFERLQPEQLKVIAREGESITSMDWAHYVARHMIPFLDLGTLNPMAVAVGVTISFWESFEEQGITHFHSGFVLLTKRSRSASVSNSAGDSRAEVRAKEPSEKGAAQSKMFDRTLQATLKKFTLSSREDQLITQVNQILDETLKIAVHEALRADYGAIVLDSGVSGSTARQTQTGIPFDFDVSVNYRGEFEKHERLYGVLDVMKKILVEQHSATFEKFLSCFLGRDSSALEVEVMPFDRRSARLSVGRLLLFDKNNPEMKFRVDVGINPEEWHFNNLGYTRKFNEQLAAKSPEERSDILANIRLLKHILSRLGIYKKPGLQSLGTEKMILRLGGGSLNRALEEVYERAVVTDDGKAYYVFTPLGQIVDEERKQVIPTEEDGIPEFFNKPRMSEEKWEILVKLARCFHETKKNDQPFDIETIIQQTLNEASGTKLAASRAELRTLASVAESMPDFSSPDFNLTAGQMLNKSIFRSEARRLNSKVRDVFHLKQEAAVVMEQSRIDALSPEMYQELLALAVLNRSELRLVIPDGVHGKYSARIAELQKMASVSFKIPAGMSLEKIPVIGFSDSSDTLAQFQTRLDAKLAERIQHSAFLLEQPGSIGFGILFASNSDQAPRNPNGFHHDPSGYWTDQVRSELRAYAVISSAA